MTSRPTLISPSLLALPAAQTVVLSPSDRARRAFARAWARAAQTERGATLLPRFMTMKSWFATLWEEGQLFGLIADTRSLLSPIIEMALWRHVATNVSGASRAESALLAERFAEAWSLEHGYRDATGQTAFASGSSGELYRAARRQFVDALDSANAITAAQLPHALANETNAYCQTENKHFILTPSFSWPVYEKSVFTKIVKNSVNARYIRASSDNVVSINGLRVNIADSESERHAVIAWARESFNGDPSALRDKAIAIVVPDLQRSRGVWQRALRDASLPFNVSLGLAVSKYPWAAAGFALVGALFAPMAPETIAQALRHPRWGRSEATIAAINRREIELLRRGEPEITLTAFCDPSVDALRDLSQKILAIANELAKRSVRESRAHWRSVFERAITALTDGSPTLDSQTFQLREALLASIETWQQLDGWLPRVSASDAQQELVAITDSAAFQPEGSDAPIQVIGLLESAGVPFDAMWVTAFSERVLPEASRANPFLSSAWQKEHRVGLANLDECDARAARLVDGWQGLSGELIASLPQQVDEEAQVWSPLAANWQTRSAPPPHWPSQEANRSIETVDDELAPSWRPQTTRGVRALEAQANCPRRGFAEGRLRLTAWPEPSDGLSPQIRGILVHDIAEQIGRSLQSAPMQFAALRDELPALIALAVKSAADDHRHLPDHVWRAEQTRLETVFTRLLESEAMRSAFQVIDVERPAEVALGALNFSLRIDRVDRIDRIEGGNESTAEALHSNLTVIDFKSGNVERARMIDERLTAPQLPLYAYALGFDTIDALAYARVTDDHQDFVSFGNAHSGFDANAKGKTKSPPWETLVAQWRNQLELLANELVQGEATLTPAYGEKTCRSCDFQRFCRVDLQRIAASDGDDAKEEGDR